jgi:hypothetical protein
MRGALVVDRPMDGALARLVKANKGALIVVSSKLKDGQRRFAIAHELGHHELHAGKDALGLCTNDDMRSKDLSQEGEANAFATELLLPQRLVTPRCDVKTPSLEHAHDIANEFQVSFIAAARRFVELTPEACALVVSEQGRISWSIPNKDFGMVPLRGRGLDRGSLAFDIAAGRRQSGASEEVHAAAWLGEYGRGYLIEHTMQWGNALATLLWRPVN